MTTSECKVMTSSEKRRVYCFQVAASDGAWPETARVVGNKIVLLRRGVFEVWDGDTRVARFTGVNSWWVEVGH